MGSASPAGSARNGQEGMSLIEVMIAAAVLATALVAMLGSIITNSRVKILANEEYLAMTAAQAKIAEIRSRSFVQIWRIYNTDITDNPAYVTQQWTYGDPVTATSRACAHNMFQVGSYPFRDLRPPENAAHTRSDPHGEVIIVNVEAPDETSFGNGDMVPYSVDIDGADANGDGNAYNDNPASWPLDINGAAGLQVPFPNDANGDGDYDDAGEYYFVRWKSQVTGRNEQITVRSLLVNRHPSG